MQPATRFSNQPFGGSSGDWRHRFLRHHMPIALTSAIVLILFMTLPTFNTSADHAAVDLSSGALPQQRGERGTTEHGEDQAGATNHGGGQGEPTDPEGTMEMTGSRTFVQRFTVATGYVATGLLALTLLIGPANLLFRRRNPVSNYLSRDVGTWAATGSVVHVIFGLQVHGQLSAFLDYFVALDGSPLLNSFGLGNWTGLAATVIVVGLFAISSDFALRKLKAKPWKRLQRLNYALFALVTAHAFFYGAMLRVTSPYTFLLGFTVITVFVGQAVGVWLWRRRHARRGGALPQQPS